MHYPVDITWKREKIFDFGDSWYDLLTLTVTDKGKSKDYPMWLSISSFIGAENSFEACLTFELPKELKDVPPPLEEISKEDADECKAIMAALPLDFLYDIADQIKKDCHPDTSDDEYLDVSISWPFSKGAM